MSSIFKIIPKILKPYNVYFLSLLLLFLAGCSAAPSPNDPIPGPELSVQSDSSSADVSPDVSPSPAPTPAPTATPTPTPTPTPEPVAELITDGFAVKLNGMGVADSLSDNNLYSRIYINPKGSLSIESEIPFSALYIEWWVIPEACTIVWDSGSIECGSYSFLHDYIELPKALNSISIVSGESSSCTVSSIQLYTEGKTPDTLQNWQPPFEKADILVFPTHSDDDVLFFGPLISHYSIEEKLNVQTAFMVNHAVSPIRAHERLNGLWELGVRNYPILGNAPDSATHDFYEARNLYISYEIDKWQTEQIRRFRPSVVVGHDLNGEYGNGGHKINAHYLVQSIEAASDPERFPESAETYGVWDCPKLYLHLYEENQIVLDVNTTMENDPEGRTPFEIAKDAFLHHVSQQGWNFYVAQEENPEYDCRLFGLYRTLVGPDTKADIMDNISTN